MSAAVKATPTSDTENAYSRAQVRGMKAEIQWLRNAVCDGRAYLRYYRGKGRADPQGDAVDGYLTRVALVNRGKVQP